jgi:hypothetical protein
MFEAPCPDGYKKRYHKGTDKRKADTSIFFFAFPVEVQLARCWGLNEAGSDELIHG